MKRLAVVTALVVAVAACTSETAPSTTPLPTTEPTTTLASESTPPTSPPEAAPTTPPTTAPEATPEPLEGWGRLEVDTEVFGTATINTGAAANGRFVLGGCRNSDGGFPLWRSDDGSTWQRAQGPDDVECVTDIEASAFGYYAEAPGAANLVHSEDGVGWERLDLSDDFGFDSSGQLGAVFAIFVSPDDDQVTLLYSRAAENESRIATLVTTTDGVTWEQGPTDSAALFDNSSVSAVIEGGPGLLAVGASPGGEFVPTAAVFTSPNGLDWTRVTPRNSDFDDSYMLDVMAIGTGYVTVGAAPFKTGLMTAWTSPDGIEWSLSPSPSEETDPAVAHMAAETLTTAGGSIWAAGLDFDARRDDSLDTFPAVWSSADGVTWTRADFDQVRGAIPFVVIDTPDIRIGVWPPPFSIDPGPLQLFAAD